MTHTLRRPVVRLNGAHMRYATARLASLVVPALLAAAESSPPVAMSLLGPDATSNLVARVVPAKGVVDKPYRSPSRIESLARRTEAAAAAAERGLVAGTCPTDADLALLAEALDRAAAALELPTQTELAQIDAAGAALDAVRDAARVHHRPAPVVVTPEPMPAAPDVPVTPEPEIPAEPAPQDAPLPPTDAEMPAELPPVDVPAELPPVEVPPEPVMEDLPPVEPVEPVEPPVETLPTEPEPLPPVVEDPLPEVPVEPEPMPPVVEDPLPEPTDDAATPPSAETPPSDDAPGDDGMSGDDATDTTDDAATPPSDDAPGDDGMSGDDATDTTDGASTGDDLPEL
jgi:hypothetical protein